MPIKEINDAVQESGTTRLHVHPSSGASDRIRSSDSEGKEAAEAREGFAGPENEVFFSWSEEAKEFIVFSNGEFRHARHIRIDGKAEVFIQKACTPYIIGRLIDGVLIDGR
jgi:hypothetical protein